MKLHLKHVEIISQYKNLNTNSDLIKTDIVKQHKKSARKHEHSNEDAKCKKWRGKNKECKGQNRIFDKLVEISTAKTRERVDKNMLKTVTSLCHASSPRYLSLAGIFEVFVSILGIQLQVTNSVLIGQFSVSGVILAGHSYDAVDTSV